MIDAELASGTERSLSVSSIQRGQCLRSHPAALSSLELDAHFLARGVLGASSRAGNWRCAVNSH